VSDAAEAKAPTVHRAQLRTGVSVPYVSAGEPSGMPLVLLHAWAEARGCFDRLTPRLPSSLQVIAMDQRGARRGGQAPRRL
jgi:hypothetical protein